jgi:hypothetical protein
MTNPTSNFGWQMPTPTDLVTDLPADFEVFGQAVDTDFADLLGGTTGQVLSKTTNTDLDFTWVTPEIGDITAITVSSPLTGGGTSGSVSVGILSGTTSNLGAVQLSDSTSSTSTTLAATANAVKTAYDLANTANTTAGNAIAKSTVTTAGDIIYRNATVPTRLGIGTANQVLAVNSGATAPEWKTISTSPTFVGVNATRTNVSTAVTANTEILVAFPTEEFDSNGFHDNSTNNSRLTIPSGYAGKYIVSAYCNNPNSPGSYQLLRLFKNGVLYTTGGVYGGEYARTSTGFGNQAFGFSQTITTSVADYWEIKYQQNNTETVNMYFNFQLTYVGA